jgi:hypothetical protein
MFRNTEFGWHDTASVKGWMVALAGCAQLRLELWLGTRARNEDLHNDAARVPATWIWRWRVGKHVVSVNLGRLATVQQRCVCCSLRWITDMAID